MASLRITAADVAGAIREQNVQAPAGQVGQPPAGGDQSFQYSLRVRGRLVDADEFADIIVGSQARRFLHPPARRRPGRTRRRGLQLQGELADSPGRHGDLARARRQCPRDRGAREGGARSGGVPRGLDYKVMYDTSDFVSASIEEVLRTFVEALLLVLVVVFLFLQSWRATLIPMLAVPVSLVATFAAFESWVSASTRCRCSAWCSRSASSSTTRSSSSRPSSTTCTRTAVAARGDAQGDGRGAGPGDRDRAGAVGGVHSDGIRSGRDRAALQAVRSDGRGVDDVLRARRADADAGAVLDAAPAARAGERRGGPLRDSSSLQPGLRPHQSSLRRVIAGTRRAPRARRRSPSWSS